MTYRVPSMREIALFPWNGLTVASLFAGIGGSSLGYRMSGYRVAYANEFAPSAAKMYGLNKSKATKLDARDVHDVSAQDIGEVDCLDGSPPCTRFSMSGTQKAARGIGRDKEYDHGAKQRDEELFAEYVRLRDALRPKVFVAENVPGLVRGVAKGFFLEIMRQLKRGYRVEARLLDAQWLGVPQRRQRLIFVGVREDLGLDPAFPDPLPARISVREALAKPPPSAEIEPETDIDGHAIAREWDRLNPGQQSDRYFNLFRAPWAEPAQTITASGGMNSGIACVTHPGERRKFAVWELKRLCGFPDDFRAEGSYAERYRGLGNSVPPVMMFHVASAIRDRVLLPARAEGRSKATRNARNKSRGSSPPATAAASSPAPRTRRRGAAAPTDAG